MTTMQFNVGNQTGGHVDPLADAVGRLRNAVLDRQLADELGRLRRATDERERRAAIAMSRGNVAPPADTPAESPLVADAKQRAADARRRELTLAREQSGRAEVQANAVNALANLAADIGLDPGAVPLAARIVDDVERLMSDPERRRNAAARLRLPEHEVERRVGAKLAEVARLLGLDNAPSIRDASRVIAEATRQWEPGNYVDLLTT